MKTTEGLLADLIWQGAIQVYYQILQLNQLEAINEGIKKLATAEQITALTEAIDALETATETEIAQINAKIDELIAAAQGEPDEALDAQIVRLQAQRDRIATIIPDAPTEPTE